MRTENGTRTLTRLKLRKNANWKKKEILIVEHLIGTGKRKQNTLK